MQDNDNQNDFDEDLERLQDKYGEKEIVPDASTNSGYALGINFMVSILVCAFMGYWADVYLESKPWGVIIGVILGFSAGFWQVWKTTFKSEE